MSAPDVSFALSDELGAAAVTALGAHPCDGGCVRFPHSLSRWRTTFRCSACGLARGAYIRWRISSVVALARTPRSRWVDEGLDALADGGPDAVRIESLARALGVTKGGFYGYFEDRQALFDVMLDAWERSTVDDVIDRVEAGGGDDKAKLRRLSRLAAARRGAALKIDLAVRDWARRDKRVGRRLKRVDDRRMDYLRKLFAPPCRDDDDLEVSCLLFYSLWIGNHFIAADHLVAVAGMCSGSPSSIWVPNRH